jgi:hypothetical protein
MLAAPRDITPRLLFRLAAWNWQKFFDQRRGSEVPEAEEIRKGD